MMLSVLLRLTAYPFGIFWSWCCLYFFDWRLTPLVSFGHDVVCTSSIDGLPLWYLLVMMLSVLLRPTAYPFGIFWSWCCLYFFDWRLTPLVSFGHDVVCIDWRLTPLVSFGHDVVCTSSIDGLPLWYLLVMMLSVLLRLTAYPFGIFWSWCCLYFFDWRLTPLVSFGHDVVCTSSIDGLPLWYLLVMMLSVLLRLTAYPFGIFWSWCCLYFFDWRLTPLVSFGHDVVCTSSIDGLPLWYLLVMMLSVLLRLTAYPFGIFWSWCCLYFFDWRLTPLVSFGHDVVCTSSIDGLPLWYLLVMMLSVLLRLTAYPFGIFWSWCCLYFFDWRLTPLVSFGHDVVCTSSIDGLPLWYLLVMMLSVLLRLTAYPFGIFWSWCCLYFFDWRLTPLVSFGHDVVCTSSIDGLPLWYLLVMMLSVLLRLTAYPFGIFWSWCCLYFFDWRLTPLVSFGHDVVCTSSIDGLPLWYLLVMMLSVLLRLTAYPFGIFWSWCCLYFFDWRLTPLVSFGHDVVCTSSIDGLPLWYLLVMMLSVLLRLTAYPFGIFWSWCCLYFRLTAYPFGIFWSWCCLYFFDWRLTPLVSFGHDVVCTSSIDGLPFGIFWSWCCLYFFDWRLTLWYLLVMMLSVLLRLTAYPFGIFWSWCCLYFFDWRLTPLVSFGHDVVCTSAIDGLLLWYLLVMMLSVLLRLTAYPFGIFWSWCCLYFFDWPAYPFGIFWSWCCLYFFDWRLTPLVSFGHDVVCTSSIDGLPLWYLLVMMLSVLLRLTAYPFGIFWSWCCLYFFDWRLTPLVSFGHDVVCTSSIDGLPLWYLLVMMLSVLLRLTAYPFGIFWSWCCLYFFDWRLTPLVSFGHDVVCTSSIDGLPLWYLLVMMLSVLLRLTAYPFGIFWSWCCLYFFDWRLTPLVSFGHDVVCTSSIDGLPLWYLLVMMLSVLLRLTAYPFGIFWSWCCLYFFDWRLTPLVSFGHDVVCTSSIDGLPLWYLLVMMLSVLLRLTAYPFGIFWSWCCLYFFDWRLTPLVSFGHDVVCTSSIDGLPLWYLLVMMLSVLLRLTAYPFGIFWSWCCLYFFDWRLTPLVSFGHDVVCTSSIDGLPLWYLLVMMLSVLLRLTAYPFGIFWSWCCLYFFDWRLTPLVSFGHDVVCTSSIDGLPLWYLLVMMLSVLLRLTAYPFGIFWSWCCLYFFDWRLTPLVSFGHDVVCTSSIDGLPLWYLLVMMLSVLLRLTAYPFGIFWSWCCLYFFDWRLTPLVSFGHDVVCTSSIDGLPLWYLLVMMLSVLLRLTAYPFGIFWSWCCLYFFDWRLTPLVSFGHDVVCTSSIDGLPLWYLLVMMLSVLLRLTAYPFGIFWSWCCLYFFDWRLTPLVSFGHDVVCTSSIDGLPLWYLLVMMLSVLLRLTAYPFGIFWSWCCLYFFDWRLTPLVSFGHDVVCTSIDSFDWRLTPLKYRQHHDQEIPKG